MESFGYGVPFGRTPRDEYREEAPMRPSKRSAIILVFLIIVVAGCGGGLSGSGGGSLVYDGSTSHAVVDGSTARDTAVGAYLGGGSGASMVTLASVATGADTQGGSRTVEFAGMLRDVVEKINPSPLPSGSRALANDSGTIQGDCSGSAGTASYSIGIDPLSGTFTGTFSFNAYCSGGTTLNGTAAYSGSIDLALLDIGKMSISFGSLSVSSPSDSFTTSGSVSFDLSTDPAVVTMTMVMRDDTTMETVKVENLGMTLADNSVYVDMVMNSGRFYHPQHGYADCRTTSPVRLYYSDDWPGTGVLVCVGAAASKARLTFTSITQYRVEADADGDDIYEYDSGLLYWADL